MNGIAEPVANLLLLGLFVLASNLFVMVALRLPRWIAAARNRMAAAVHHGAHRAESVPVMPDR